MSGRDPRRALLSQLMMTWTTTGGEDVSATHTVRAQRALAVTAALAPGALARCRQPFHAAPLLLTLARVMAADALTQIVLACTPVFWPDNDARGLGANPPPVVYSSDDAAQAAENAEFARTAPAAAPAAGRGSRRAAIPAQQAQCGAVGLCCFRCLCRQDRRICQPAAGVCPACGCFSECRNGPCHTSGVSANAVRELIKLQICELATACGVTCSFGVLQYANHLEIPSSILNDRIAVRAACTQRVAVWLQSPELRADFAPLLRAFTTIPMVKDIIASDSASFHQNIAENAWREAPKAALSIALLILRRRCNDDAIALRALPIVATLLEDVRVHTYVPAAPPGASGAAPASSRPLLIIPQETRDAVDAAVQRLPSAHWNNVNAAVGDIVRFVMPSLLESRTPDTVEHIGSEVTAGLMLMRVAAWMGQDALGPAPRAPRRHQAHHLPAALHPAAQTLAVDPHPSPQRYDRRVVHAPAWTTGVAELPELPQPRARPHMAPAAHAPAVRIVRRITPHHLWQGQLMPRPSLRTVFVRFEAPVIAAIMTAPGNLWKPAGALFSILKPGVLSQAEEGTDGAILTGSLMTDGASVRLTLVDAAAVRAGQQARAPPPPSGQGTDRCSSSTLAFSWALTPDELSGRITAAIALHAGAPLQVALRATLTRLLQHRQLAVVGTWACRAWAPEHPLPPGSQRSVLLSRLTPGDVDVICLHSAREEVTAEILAHGGMQVQFQFPWDDALSANRRVPGVMQLHGVSTFTTVLPGGIPLQVVWTGTPLLDADDGYSNLELSFRCIGTDMTHTSVVIAAAADDTGNLRVTC